jgi:hypothetical protein
MLFQLNGGQRGARDAGNRAAVPRAGKPPGPGALAGKKASTV